MKKTYKTSARYRLAKDKIVFGCICLLTSVTMVPLFLILSELLRKGYKQLNLNLFTEIAPTTMEAMIARMNHELIPGGILNGLTGTVLILSIAIMIAIPLGILVGIYLAENGERRFAKFIRSLTDLMQGIPSIVIGIIVYSWVVKPMHGYSALAGSISLAIMMLPMVIRSTEESLKMLPLSLKEAGLALGGSYMSVILRILLPSAFGGLFTGSLLAISRVTGETAPLLVTALGAAMVNWDVTQPTSAISLLIWEFYNDPNLADLVWSSSLLLLFFVLGVNIFAKSVASRWKIQ
ncbi:phosphate ABC transporter permease PstA [Parabacteroides sp. Marseille-P3160]|jgi:phosphate transport system permease protein|uniref:phosphate ABC transporter permease PstA n=1 Tax=Parabacteroides sp. Marseille-P3160 TaxID=1917887 RepID=UPI0009BA2D4C|nr:phosphate ABC transporter permease PstA [Parabacteroides sp. Marseille-P3160]